jgi:hypothetical protein
MTDAGHSVVEAPSTYAGELGAIARAAGASLNDNPYRWGELGAIARAAGASLNDNPYRWAHKRLEWERGWLHEDAEIAKDGREL